MASGHVNRTQRPNTWLHRPSLQREDSPCQLGAVHTWPSVKLERQTSIACDHSAGLAKSFSDGYLDIACLVMSGPSVDLGKGAFAWEEKAAWLRSRDFALSPGSVI